jgi:hypothetical protein
MKKLKISLTLAVIAAVFLLTGCQSGQVKPVVTPTVLAKFTITGDMNDILLPVEFDGKVYPFLLDTGTTNTVFDDSFKDRLGKRILWPKKGEAAYGKKVTVELFNAPDAYFGPFNLKNMRIITATDLSKIVPDDKRDFQGIIGMDFMKGYIVRMDFDNDKLTFLKGSKESGLFSLFKPEKNEHPEWGEPVPLKTEWFSDLRYIKGRLLDKIKAEFLIDSGWHFPGVLKSSLFNKVNSLIARTKNENHTSAMETSNRGKIIITEKFSVGSLEYKDMFFQKSNISILGLPFLSRHVVTFDFPNNVMYLQKGKDFDKPSVPPIYIQGLDFALQYSGNKAVVSFVDPNGPAYEKGVRQNDILVKINDKDISSYDVMEFAVSWTSLFSKPLDAASFTFKRGDDTMTIKFVKNDNKDAKIK